MTTRRVSVASLARPVALMLLAASVDGARRDHLSSGLAAFALVGAMIIWKRPTNGIGWLLSLIGSFPSLSGFTAFAPETDVTLAVGRILSQLNSTAFGLVAFLVLLFPSGHLPSRRWLWPARIGGAGMGVVALLGIVRPDAKNNPLGVRALQPVVDAAFVPAAFVIGGLGIAALVNAFARMRRATGDEREQLRWFACSAAVFPAIMVVNAASQGKPWQGTVLFLAFTVGLAAIAGAIGVAILKYRLYAIDVVINKTLVFGALAAFITAIYVAVVVGIGQIVSSREEPNLGLSLVATTIVAVTFQAARQRMQTFANRLVYGHRLSPYETVASFAHRVAASFSFDHVLPEMAEVAALGVGAARARVRLILPSGAEETASWPEPDSREQFDYLVPVLHNGEHVGEIAIAKPVGQQVTKHDELLLRDLASEAGLAMSSLRLTEQLKERLVDLQESRRRLLSAQDEERRRMERDIHDGAQQQLVSMKIKVGIARSLLDSDPAKVDELLQSISVDASDAVATLRDLARGLFPDVLVSSGLARAVEAHVAKTASDADVTVTATPELGRFDIETEANVYFVIREALQNASKYAHGAHVDIELGTTRGDLVFEVRDDGPGFESATVVKGNGTNNMRDRIEALGGSLRVESSGGRGTAVIGSVPGRTEETVITLVETATISA